MLKIDYYNSTWKFYRLEAVAETTCDVMSSQLRKTVFLCCSFAVVLRKWRHDDWQQKEKGQQRVTLTSIMTPHMLSTMPHAASLGPQINTRIINVWLRKGRRLALTNSTDFLMIISSVRWLWLDTGSVRDVESVYIFMDVWARFKKM